MRECVGWGWFGLDFLGWVVGCVPVPGLLVSLLVVVVYNVQTRYFTEAVGKAGSSTVQVHVQYKKVKCAFR